MPKIYLISVYLISMSIMTYASSTIKMTCSTDNPEGSLHVLLLKEFKKKVTEYSSGKIKTILHFKGNKEFPAIRGEEANVQMVRTKHGRIQVTMVAVGNASQYMPILNFFMLPYIFPEIKSAYRLLKSTYLRKEVNNIISKKYGIRILGWGIGGFRHMTNSRTNVRRINDIKGLVIRTPKNKLMVETYEALGAIVKPIKWSDTFKALKELKVDGQENPYNVIFYSEFWKAHQKFLTMNGPFLWTGPLLISEDFFQSLSGDFKLALRKAGNDASEYEWKWIEQKNNDFKKALTEKGMIISALEDKEKWIEVGMKIWRKYYKNIGGGNPDKGKAIVKKVLKIMKKR